jgi:hypothetical protein
MDELKGTQLTEKEPIEIPPIFKIAHEIKSEKAFDNVVLYRVATCSLILILLIILNVFFSDVFVIIDSWLTERLEHLPATL